MENNALLAATRTLSTSAASTTRPRILTRLLTIGVLSISASLLSACNTTEGVGKDVKSLGKGVEGAAQDAKN